MAIEKKLIHFGKLADFEAQLTAGNILDRSIVFIQDAKKIWTHGTYYDCSEGGATGDEFWYVDDTTDKLTTDYDIEVLAELQSSRLVTSSIAAFDGNEYTTGNQGQVLTADGDGNMHLGDLSENVYITDFSIEDLEALHNGDVEEINFQAPALSEAISQKKRILVPFFDGGYALLVGEAYGVEEVYFTVYTPSSLVFACEAYNGVISRDLLLVQDVTAEKIGTGSSASVETLAVANGFLSHDNSEVYVLPDVANGDEANILATKEMVDKKYTKPSGGIPTSDLDGMTRTVLEMANQDHQVIEDINSDVANLYDVKQDNLVSGTNIKTINGESILGGGDITIEGGAKVYKWFYNGESESVTLSQEEYDNIVEADIVLVNWGGLLYFPVNKTSKEFSEAYGRYALIGQFRFQEIDSYIELNIEVSTKLAEITIKQQEILTKTSQLENDSDFISSTNLKTINGESIVGSGDIEIGGGRKEVNELTLDINNIILKPNEIVNFRYVLLNENIVISGFEDTHYLEDGLFDAVTEYDEYFLQFTTNSGGSNVSLTLPDEVRWANGEIPQIEDGTCYELSITRQRITADSSNYKAVLTPFKSV